MKSLLIALMFVGLFFVSIARAQTPSKVRCYVYDGKTPGGIALRFDGVSEATEDIYKGGLPDHSSEKFSNGQVSIELTDNVGCASQCWHTRKLAIKYGGAVAFAEGDAKTLNDENGSNYPSVTLRINGQRLSASCSGPLEQPRSLMDEMGEQLRDLKKAGK